MKKIGLYIAAKYEIAYNTPIIVNKPEFVIELFELFDRMDLNCEESDDNDFVVLRHDLIQVIDQIENDEYYGDDKAYIQNFCSSMNITMEGFQNLIRKLINESDQSVEVVRFGWGEV